MFKNFFKKKNAEVKEPKSASFDRPLEDESYFWMGELYCSIEESENGWEDSICLTHNTPVNNKGYCLLAVKTAEDSLRIIKL